MTEQQRPDIAAEVRSLIARFAPSWALDKGLADDQPLGTTGLGLDSVALVELIVAAEAQFGVPCPDSLLDGSPLTVGRLIDHVAAAKRPAGDP